MANKGKIEMNQRRKNLIDKYQVKRAVLKKIQKDKDVPLKDKISATIKLAALPRNSSQVRYRRRCVLSGRPRGMCLGGLDRITFRNKALKGEIPGVVLSSW